METDTNNSALKKFITTAIENQQVWGLKSSEGWTVAMSNQYENTQVYVFWDSQLNAAQCAKEEWQDYKPESIPLYEFLEDWCIAIFEENSLCGVQWNYDGCGDETEPMELAQALVQELRKTGTTIKFSKYPSLQKFANLIDQAILDDQDFSG